jgi:hypothetical protein
MKTKFDSKCLRDLARHFKTDTTVFDSRQHRVFESIDTVSTD